jgi:hypothetical protein
MPSWSRILTLFSSPSFQDCPGATEMPDERTGGEKDTPRNPQHTKVANQTCSQECLIRCYDCHDTFHRRLPRLGAGVDPLQRGGWVGMKVVWVAKVGTEPTLTNRSFASHLSNNDLTLGPGSPQTSLFSRITGIRKNQPARFPATQSRQTNDSSYSPFSHGALESLASSCP